VLRQRNGLVAVRYAGIDDLRGVQAFYRLNKVRDLDGFSAVLAAGGIPSLDFVYADRFGRIAAFYNGAYPERPDGYDWTKPVAGNISASLWSAYRPPELAPKAVQPGSGFVIAAGATPYRTTIDPFNPKPELFPVSMGIEQGMSNRARRALALFGSDRSITADEFRTYKYDTCYAPDSDFAVLTRDLASRNYAGDPVMEEAGEDLRRFNLCTDQSNRGAALAVLTVAPVLQARSTGTASPDPAAALRTAANRLLTTYKRLDPEWGTIQPPAARHARSAALRRAGHDGRCRARAPAQPRRHIDGAQRR
jgi:penicillin amidase/acyl-homoserine-lactone acylase